jgi:hypothetical protein
VEPVTNKKQLIEMLEAFVDGRDCSYDYVERIAGFLTDHFYDDEEFQELLEAVASYSPQGGEYLHDERSLCKLIVSVTPSTCLTMQV